jgi:hypothetical protein
LRWLGPKDPGARDLASPQDTGHLGAEDFDRMFNDAVERSPVGELVDIMDVGFACAFLATPYGQRLTIEPCRRGASIMA